MEVVSVDTRKKQVVVKLDLEDIEFIGCELPSGDSFTQDWWGEVCDKLSEEPED